MNQILELVVQYRFAGMAILFGIQMIMLIIAIHMVRKLSRYIASIHEKVQEYLQVVLADNEKEDEQPVAQHLVSEQEKQMMNSIMEKKKQQEEAVFNAVLQEIFP